MRPYSELNGLPLAEVAFYARLGLQVEVITLTEMSEWVDDVLLRADAADAFYLGLYRSLRQGKPEVLTYLSHAVPAELFSVRPVLGWLQQAVGTWSLGQLIRALYRLRTLAESDQEVGWIYALAAEYEQAADGPAEVLGEVHRETEAFLACYQEYTFSNRHQWLYLDAVLPLRWASLRQ